jgi:hypothetical protein
LLAKNVSISPDKVAKETNNDGSISVLFEKQVNGRTLTITVLSNKKNTLTLKSTRIFKTSISSPNDTNASSSTSKTMGGTRGSSDTIITEKTDLSSGKYGTIYIPYIFFSCISCFFCENMIK